MRTLKPWTPEQLINRFGEEITNHALGPCGVAQYREGRGVRLIVGIHDGFSLLARSNHQYTHGLVFKPDRKYIRYNHCDPNCGIDTLLAIDDDNRTLPDDRLETIVKQLKEVRGESTTPSIATNVIDSVMAEKMPALQAAVDTITSALGLKPGVDVSYRVRRRRNRFVVEFQVVTSLKENEPDRQAPAQVGTSSTTTIEQLN